MHSSCILQLTKTSGSKRPALISTYTTCSAQPQLCCYFFQVALSLHPVSGPSPLSHTHSTNKECAGASGVSTFQSYPPSERPMPRRALPVLQRQRVPHDTKHLSLAAGRGNRHALPGMQPCYARQAAIRLPRKWSSERSAYSVQHLMAWHGMVQRSTSLLRSLQQFLLAQWDGFRITTSLTMVGQFAFTDAMPGQL